MGIKHRAVSACSKFLVLSKLSIGGQVRSSDMPYVLYPNRYGQGKKPKLQKQTDLGFNNNGR
jgi:hypothetical protein